MLHHKTVNTKPALVAAQARHAEFKAGYARAMAAFNDMNHEAAQHDRDAAAADLAAVEHGNTLAALVGSDADESQRAPVRAAQADAIACAAFHRNCSKSKREQLPRLRSAVDRGFREQLDVSGVNSAEFNDALAAYLEFLPTLEPLVTRLRAAAAALGRRVADDAYQHSALPLIQGGHLFGQRLEREHYAPPVEVTQ